MSTLSGIITPSNLTTADNTQTFTNKTIDAASNTISNVGLSTDVTGTLPVVNGGTGSTSASGARTNLSAASSGANSDITSLSGLTTALSVAQGGTGGTTGAAARSNIGAAAAGANSDITSLSGLTSPSGGLVGVTEAQTLTSKTITGLKETKVAIAASDIDLSAGNYFTKTISGATTLTLSNVASSGSVSAFVLDLTNGGSATVTWFSGVKWNAATAPTLTASGRDVLAFFSHDGGTTWNGFVLGLGMA